MSEAGRKLFGVTRERRATPSDAYRLRIYFARFGVVWQDIHPDSR